MDDVAEVEVAEKEGSDRAPDILRLPMRLGTEREPAKARDWAEMESSPVATPPEVILHVLERTATSLDSLPKVILPETERFPPVEIPEEKSPNEAETPDPCWGGEL